MSEPLLAVDGLVKHFPMDRRRKVQAVNDVSFEIGAGEALALVGESGSGKTTTGRCILRLIDPTAGAIRFDGTDLLALDPKSFRRLRPRIQMVFQEPYDSLSPRMRIGAIVEEPLKLAGEAGPAERRERVAEILDLVRLGSGAMYRYPHQFSAGQQQRIGIARALATRPDLVVLDEPTSALDVSVRAEVLDLLSELRADLGVSYLFISHDLTAVRRVCDRVAIMYLGKIVETGETEAIFERPAPSLQPRAPVVGPLSGPAGGPPPFHPRRGDPEPHQPAPGLPPARALPVGRAPVRGPLPRRRMARRGARGLVPPRAGDGDPLIARSPAPAKPGTGADGTCPLSPISRRLALGSSSPSPPIPGRRARPG